MPGTPTTGLGDLDAILRVVLPGDNIVWQIDSVADYQPFVGPFYRAGLDEGEKVIYFRFAEHEPLLSEGSGVEVHNLHPEEGFEKFIRQIHTTIDDARSHGVYVFDCLSDLAADWYSDRMLGNFFLLICPYVYDMQGLAYFAMLRNHHSVHACSTIAETTQILIDVFRHKDKLYIHPLKAQRRQSPTMYMLHVCENDKIRPVTDSNTTAEVLTSMPYMGAPAAQLRPGVWDRAFLSAEQTLEGYRKRKPASKEEKHLRRLLRMLISRNERMLDMAEKHFSLQDLLRIRHRTIGTGLIGGKSTGMLLARAILRRSNPRWDSLLEEHDSFFIGSDVFYTYLVKNGCWRLREQQQDKSTFLKGAEEARRRILTGRFSKTVLRGFRDMLDYFGQSPIIVRSSSFLEDAFGNSFAGKYLSVFCVNQGSRDERLEDFLTAVKEIYASTMSEQALQYRSRRDILDHDEQMSLLVQRVSGSMQDRLFYPQAAGVALSYNPYVWNEQIDPQAGVMRLVFGLGTRAVDRTDDDYTRVVALNAPEKRPEGDLDKIRRYTQRKVDILDTAANQLVSRDFAEVASQNCSIPLKMFVSRDEEVDRLMAETGRHDAFPWMLTFEKLLLETGFVTDMQDMLKTLQNAYGCPVDTEFTLNFVNEDTYRINLVQCRPLQVSTADNGEELPATLSEEDVVFAARGAVVGQSRDEKVDRLIYVVPSVYGGLPVNERYAVARLIGRLMHQEAAAQPQHVMLFGPGRWGTTMPSLGIPVSYAEINKVSFLGEIVTMHEDLVPDVSLGTHFFNELVEADILYLALFPGRDGNRLNEDFLGRTPNRLEQLLPDMAHRANVVHVIDAEDVPGNRSIHINANNVKQEVVCYLQ
jgi:hypothetical protein